MTALDAVLPYLSCPGDQGRLARQGRALVCHTCGRRYPLLGEDFAELLPPKPAPLSRENPAYRDAYLLAFHRPYVSGSRVPAWGRPDLMPRSWSVKKGRQRRFVSALLKRTEVICDVSGGAGTCSFELARQFPWVIHCDLCPRNLADVHRRRDRAGIRNLILIRCDYLQLPFDRSLPQLICLDTLIRGKNHERRLLKGLAAALAPGGAAIIDFHNWWHNPLRRLGLMPDNFDVSHTQKEALALLRVAGCPKFSFHPFCQEIPEDAPAWQARTLQALLPPTRLVFRVEAG